MRRWFRFTAIALLAAAILPALCLAPAAAQSRAHVYLFRGLADVFSTGMDTLADELNRRGVYATSHSHTDWKQIALGTVRDYKAKKEGPIILVGHSLGADAVMEMADYLGDQGVPVALVVPFDGTQSFPVPGNVGHVINFTQRDYAFMRPGPGFHGSLENVDLRSDHSIDHLTIDKSPALHARVISEVLAIVGGGHRIATPSATKPNSISVPALEPAGESKTGIIAPPPTSVAPPKADDADAAKAAAPSPPPSPKPAPPPPRPANPIQIPD